MSTNKAQLEKPNIPQEPLKQDNTQNLASQAAEQAAKSAGSKAGETAVALAAETASKLAQPESANEQPKTREQIIAESKAKYEKQKEEINSPFLKFLTLILSTLTKISESMGTIGPESKPTEESTENPYKSEQTIDTKENNPHTKLSEAWVIKRLENQGRSDAQNIFNYLKEECKKQNLDVGTMVALINKESGWKYQNKYSGPMNSGASGLAQLIPNTAQSISNELGRNPDPKWGQRINISGNRSSYDPFNPYFAVAAACYYAKKAGQRFGAYLHHAEGPGGGPKLLNLKRIAEQNINRKTGKPISQITAKDIQAECESNQSRYMQLLHPQQQRRIRTQSEGWWNVLHILQFAKEIGRNAGTI